MILFAAIAVTALFMVLFSVSTGVVFSNIGFGTESRPFSIYNEAQLAAVADSTRHYILRADITLSPDFTSVPHFAARLNGNGFTLTATGTNPLIRSLTGEIQNLNVIAGGKIEAVGDFAFLVIRNRGIIRNVSVTAVDARVYMEHLLDEFYNSYLARAGIMVVRNEGRIEDARVYGSLRVENVSPHNRLLMAAGIAVQNEGIIRRSKSAADITVEASTGEAEAGGIAARNLLTGSVIENSGAFGTVSGAMDGSAWFFLGGIVGWVEFGIIRNNFYVGAITGKTPLEGTAIGGIMGGARGTARQDLTIDLHLTGSNNFYVPRSPYIEVGIGIAFADNILPGFSPFFDIPDAHPDAGVQGMSEEEIRGLEIFWE
jgi:hypothetical protein